jgi:hypothetical protein
MKLASYRTGNRATYGIVMDGGVVELSEALGSQYPDLKALLAGDALADAQTVMSTRPLV